MKQYCFISPRSAPERCATILRPGSHPPRRDLEMKRIELSDALRDDRENELRVNSLGEREVTL
jgi:hypothetical protein